MIFLFICGPAMQIGLYLGANWPLPPPITGVSPLSQASLSVAPVGLADQLLRALRDILLPDLERVVDVRVTIEDRVGLVMRSPFRVIQSPYLSKLVQPSDLPSETVMRPP